ncbi:signal peptidase II [Bacillus sp. JJ1533]|uniref:signal peptidase II n=1 Tax=Bacillus sp. JJ1533 TaxID=3122959 RepID=UPI002FFDEB35
MNLTINTLESVILIHFYSAAIIAIIIDQVSKYLVRASLEVGDTLIVWEGILHFTHYQNSGAALGLFEGYGRLFVPVAIIVVGIFIYMHKKGHIYGVIMELGSGLYIGGAIGNAIDRIVFNQVTDFINFQSGGGILNLADYALNVGIVLILVDSIILEPVKKKRAEINRFIKESN